MSTASIALIPQTTPFLLAAPPPGSLPETLSAAAELAAAGQTAASVDTLRVGLNRARAEAASPEAWKADIDRYVRTHPALPVAHEHPFAARCYQKPRGYAGDAVMLDFIYRHPANRALVEQATPRGRALMAATLTTPAPRAVRNRCRLLADEIDAVCLRNPRAEILSIACGHLREAEHSAALAERNLGRFVALDQDPDSLALVRHDYCATLGVQTTPGSVKTVIARGARDLGKFDFIYAAGLYDYLSDRVGARLLGSMFAMLKPGGKVWIANFAPNIADVGFMEAVMDWWLIYRDAAGMRAMADEGLAGVASQVAALRTFQETEENVVFLEAVKA
ncbi:MAG: class I SAM-dependent methyltransferase [Bryobacterales bacterium]|nr:class I SAM-dependent methyltransferase [Bryobacterales bacterium]